MEERVNAVRCVEMVVVLLVRALTPFAVFWAPVVSLNSARNPSPVLKLPVVL